MVVLWDSVGVQLEKQGKASCILTSAIILEVFRRGPHCQWEDRVWKWGSVYQPSTVLTMELQRLRSPCYHIELTYILPDC